MKVLIVINNLYSKGNGLSASARRTRQYLREAGVDVKVLSAKNPEKDGGQPDFCLRDGKLPLFEFLVRKQGYAFAKPDAEMIGRAIQWADIIHLEEPFSLQNKVAAMAGRAGVPCVATYHLHPENLFASVGLMKSRYFNAATLAVWKRKVFDRCRIVQCPTENVRQRLEREGFKAELRVISNGLIPNDPAPNTPIPNTPISNNQTSTDQTPDKRIRNGGILKEQAAENNAGGPDRPFYQLLCVGRYSNEKDQATLLKAMRYSRHAENIRLVFAGRGPTEKKLKKLAARLLKDGILKIPPVFGFYSFGELMALAGKSDLYIHCAVVEVEGLSCLEVIREGVVPVIAEGRLTATAQFAKSEKSLFPVRDAKALADRIDYWIEHPEERKAEAGKYRSIETEYDIRKSVKALIRMYEDAYNAGKKTS